MTEEKKVVRKASRKTSAAVAVVSAGEATLKEIVGATLDDAKGFIYTSASIHGPLVEAGLVEVNPAIKNENGELATRATQKGIESMNAQAAPEVVEVSAVAEVASAVVGGFTLEANVPVPTISGRGRTGASYPFEVMEVGQSFFVAASESKPNPAKSLASTVSSATARYSVGTGEFKTVKVKDYQTDEAGNVVKGEDGKPVQIGEHDEQREVMKETRKFIVRSVVENGINGARIWRTM